MLIIFHIKLLSITHNLLIERYSIFVQNQIFINIIKEKKNRIYVETRFILFLCYTLRFFIYILQIFAHSNFA